MTASPQHSVLLSRAHHEGGIEEKRVQLRKPFKELVPPDRRKALLVGLVQHGHYGRDSALDDLRVAAAKIRFLDATGLRLSTATRWPGWPRQPPGTDHIREWRDPTIKGHRWLVLTSEPYKERWEENNESLDHWCEEHGWRRELSTWEGIWNPPHTRLEVLASRDYPRWDGMMAAINGIANECPTGISR